jgi:predicted NBD/HSP70 family sugar kinase
MPWNRRLAAGVIPHFTCRFHARPIRIGPDHVLVPHPRAALVKRVLVVDIGGTHVKALASGRRIAAKVPSGPHLTPRQMVESVLDATKGWNYDVVSIGYPGPVVRGRIKCEPHNLGNGWVRFNFERAFDRPVRLINDAAMQALGSYNGGGKMLFLGLGTGLGSSLVVDGVVEPMELGHLPFKKATYETYIGEAGMERLGKKRWRKHVLETIDSFSKALEPDYIVLGGGNATEVGEPLPPNVRLGDNRNAFVGGFRLWDPDHPAVVAG